MKTLTVLSAESCPIPYKPHRKGQSPVRGWVLSKREYLFPSLFVFSIFSVLSTQNSALAAFLDTGATARIAALGGTFVAMADDASALMGNPAGLACVSRPEIITDYSRLYAGLSDDSQISHYYVGGAMPLAMGGALAVGWKQLDFAGLYTERTVSMGYGRWWTPRWAFGASLKQLQLAYSPENQMVDDYGNVQAGTPDLFAENGKNKTAYSADVGVLHKWSDRTILGVTVQDINEPNVALSSNDYDIVARTLRAGIASEVRPHLRLALGAYTRQALAHTRDWMWTGGFEHMWLDNEANGFGLRASFAAGSREYKRGAFGASYSIGAMRFDYSFSMTFTGITLGDTAGDHRFSVSYRFGSKQKSRYVWLPQNGLNTASQTSRIAEPLEEDLFDALHPEPLIVSGASQKPL